MGQGIHKTRFSAREFDHFSARLHANLCALARVLQRPGFGTEPSQLGAELEYYIVDSRSRPACLNLELRKALQDPRVTLELNRYNLEYNFDVLPLEGDAFGQLEQAILAASQQLDGVAANHGARLIPIGILPTLMEEHLGVGVMTQEPRYQALTEILLAMRGGDFAIHVKGDDELTMQRSDVTAEGACTSFQVHFNFPVEHFVATWNALTLVTPLVLAIATNSPLMLGKRLWHETRVPLFKQSTDSRHPGTAWHDLPRVELGYDWLRHSAYELFAQRVYLYPPLIPIVSEEDPGELLNQGQLPRLNELNLHNGTIWHWNRPIYSGAGNGHIRIEMRSLPAGPSACDMVANAAFHIGLAVGLREEIDALIPAIPFRFVSDNFYRAARSGMDAALIWPSLRQNRLKDRPVQDIGLSLLATASRGLRMLGIASEEIERLMGIIQHRLENGQNGSVWQLRSLAKLRQHYDQPEALQQLVNHYQQRNALNLPVSHWTLADGC